MFVLTLKWNKKTAILIILAAALLLTIIILAVGHGGGKVRTEQTQLGIQLDSCEKRLDYLAGLGWEAEADSEQHQKIVIPKEFSEVYEKYNQLQKAQGFDLWEYRGMDAEIYSYTLTNHPKGENVLVQLILVHGQVIGGDIHSTALDGFMHGIRPTPD